MANSNSSNLIDTKFYKSFQSGSTPISVEHTVLGLEGDTEITQGAHDLVVNMRG